MRGHFVTGGKLPKARGSVLKSDYIQKLTDHLKEGVIGFPTALASAVGLIMATAVLLTAIAGFGMGGSSFAMAVAIALVMMLCQATTFGELACILPTSGSVYDYISCGLGRFIAIGGTLAAYVVVHTFAAPAETMLIGILAADNFEIIDQVLGQNNMTWVLGVGNLAFFAILNTFGISAFSKAEVLLTGGMFLTLLCFSFVGLFSDPVVAQEVTFGASNIGTDMNTVLSMIGMAMFMFVGCEFVTPLAPELKNAGRNIPYAMLTGLFCVGLVMFLFGAAITRQVANVPLEGGLTLYDTPAVIPAFASQILGPFGKAWLGIGFILASMANVNTLMGGLPRILYGMGLDGALPKIFTYLHPRFKTPVFGIFVVFAIPVVHVWILKGDITSVMNLVLAAICAWVVAYLLITLSLISLRIRRPDLPRAYRSPLYPLPQIVSSVGMLIAITHITPPGMNPRDVYVPLVIMLGLTFLYAFFWTVFVRRLNPFKPVVVEDILEEEFSLNAMVEDEIHHSEDGEVENVVLGA